MSVLITPEFDSAAPMGEWNPIVGPRTTSFRAKKTSGDDGIPVESMDQVVREALQILSHCLPPTEASGERAVLAVGYVQSGKTLSFTTVSTLARDNGFGLVVVLAGTTLNLKGQSEERLEKDLGLADLQRDWRHIDDLGPAKFQDVAKTISGWRKNQAGQTAEDKPALLVTVLKNATRLHKAADVLRQLDLEGVPTLVIDDESDQAGLNTSARKNLLSGATDESGTYEAILDLRSALAHHSLLQYTATPQANLLVGAADQLSPSFAKVISSGAGYTGGRVFFKERLKDLVVKVDANEVFDPNAPFDEPPAGLQEALKVYLLGIAHGAVEDGKSNRSMMIQAHQNTDPHKLYSTWISKLLDSWSEALRVPAVRDEIRVEFTAAYRELAKTVNLLPLDTLLDRLEDKISDIRVVIVNSTSDAEKKIKWKQWFYWILVGGQKLDRGFTVEGLTVTYMPRPVSENADVLQQRARFFGYREKYIGFCRVYLIQDAIDAFVGYVEDEEFLRESLRAHEGQPLKDWKRDFILHRQIARPTRANVTGRRAKRLPLSQGWTWPKYMHLGSSARAANLIAFASLRAQADPYLTDSADLDGVIDRRTESRNLAWVGAPMEVVADFLLDLRYTALENSMLATAIEMAIGRWIEATPDANGTVIFMNDLDAGGGKGRQLSVLQSNIFVGMSPNGATGDAVQYSGDRTVLDSERLTLQLRRVKLSSPQAPIGEDYNAVPWLALALPGNIANDAWLEYD